MQTNSKLESNKRDVWVEQSSRATGRRWMNSQTIRAHHAMSVERVLANTAMMTAPITLSSIQSSSVRLSAFIQNGKRTRATWRHFAPPVHAMTSTDQCSRTLTSWYHWVPPKHSTIIICYNSCSCSCCHCRSVTDIAIVVFACFCWHISSSVYMILRALTRAR